MRHPVHDLPMEVWSRVALFVPFSERLVTFRALWSAGCLPDTNTNASNAFLQFCSEADRAERDSSNDDVDVEEGVRVLVGMGFADAEVRVALRLACGSPDLALEYLLVA